MKIKYICFYNYRDKNIERENVQSASTKIDYIIDVLNKNGITVDIISKTPVSSNSFHPSFGGQIYIGDLKSLRHFSSLGCRKNKFVYIISRVLNTIHFFLWLLFNTKKGEQIIVYHSLGYTMSLLLLKRIKGLKIIGEIEEIYQDVHKQFKLTSTYEYKFIKCCDKYIFPTSLLDKKFNITRKPSVTIHGVYKPEVITEEKFNDGKIHVVYGGTLDPQKGGAAAAAAAAAYLPSKYHIHICGFGNPSQIKKIVEDISSKSQATLTFEGELKGDDYKKFIQKCHIGLSTQNPSAAFNATSFPSKILVYLANGLQVVSIDIPAIRLSTVESALSFYAKQTPKEIANAITEIKSEDTMYSHNLLMKLDANFESQLLALIRS